MKNKGAFWKIFIPLLIVFIGIGVVVYFYGLKDNVIKYNYTVSLDAGDIELEESNIIVSSNGTVNLPVLSKEGYNFVGWYAGDAEFDSRTPITKNLKLTAKFEPQKFDILYENTKSAQNENPTSYTIEDGIITLKSIAKPGYTFNGWYDGKSSSAKKVETIDCSKLQDVTLYAKFSIIEYTITYVVEDGTNSASNFTKYTVESTDFKLYPATPDNPAASFMGWIGEDYKVATKNITIKKGTTGNLTFTAVFSGKWEYVNNTSFVNNKTEFDGIKSTNKTTFTNVSEVHEIDSFSKLVSWVEYISFYNIKTHLIIKVNYSSMGYDNIGECFDEAIAASTYPNVGSMGKSTFPGYPTVGSIYSTYVHNMPESNSETMDSLNALAGAEAATKPQTNYVFNQSTDFSVSVKRANDYNDFYVEGVSASIEVWTSNQLVYALEHGLKPIPVEGSSAEKIYNKAKVVLRSIITDNMTNYEKVQMIYEWLINNIAYDNLAFNTSTVNPSFDWVNYASWYAEGVFDNNIAVCDGIAKAFVILANIEGIPAVKVYSTDHAWNKVLLEVPDAEISGFNWYGIDATHGNVVVNNAEEQLSYRNFLFTHVFKVSEGQTTTDYAGFSAESVYNYYKNTLVTYSGATINRYDNSESLLTNGLSLDFVASNDFEVAQLVSFAKSIAPSGKSTVEVAVTYNPNTTIIVNMVGDALSFSEPKNYQTGYRVLTIGFEK